MKRKDIIEMLKSEGFKMSESYFYKLQRSGLWNKKASFEEVKTALIELQNTKTVHVVKTKLEVIMENRKAKE